MSSRQKMITLVHGTWAKDAAWTQEGGKLSKALQGAGHRVERVPWSGWNRYTARRAGAAELRNHLEQHPDLDHVIVAHSHGGNVAIRAMGGDRRMIQGLVSLNTPFLNVLRRDVGIFNNIGMLIAIAASLIPVGLGLRNGFSWMLLALYLVILIAVALGAVLFGKFYRYMLDRGQKLTIEPIGDTPIYCLNTPDDEAFGILAFLASAQDFLFLSICRGVITNQLIGAVIGGLLLFEVLPFLHLPWDWYTGQGQYTRELYDSLMANAAPGNPWNPLLVLGECVLLYMISAMYYFALYPLAVVLVLMGLTLLVTLSQGLFVPLEGLFHRFVVTLTPLKSVNARFEESVGDATDMRHSSLYNDDKTIRRIVDWIASL